jgi:predicted hydrocarbon binding protein
MMTLTGKKYEDTGRKYEFTWDVIGADLEVARPSMGTTLHVEMYRLLQFTMRDVLEQRYGTEVVDDLFFDAGVLAGKSFFDRYLRDASDVNTLVKTIQNKFQDLGVGIFRVEMADAQGKSFTFVVDEDLDCSGLPDTMDHICVYDEGFIKGILDSYTSSDYRVKEIDCWCSGARTCRFSAEKNG